MTVVAKTNAYSKSNLFDALSFLSSFASGRNLSEVMNGKRGEGDEFFTQYHDGTRATEMNFKVEMLLNRDYHDEFKQKGRLGFSRLRYELTIQRHDQFVGELGSNLSDEGPLRQVIVNTHSPNFVRYIGQCTDRWISVYLSRIVASVITTAVGKRVKLSYKHDSDRTCWWEEP